MHLSNRFSVDVVIYLQGNGHVGVSEHLTYRFNVGSVRQRVRSEVMSKLMRRNALNASSLT